MPSEPHLGFAHLLATNARRHGGVVNAATFEPLLCTSCDVHVNGDHLTTRVVVTHTFVNNGASAVNTCLAYNTDPSWQVTLLRVDTIDKKFLLSQQQLAPEDRDKNKGGVPASLLAQEHVAAASDTISCSLPWTVLSGQTIATTLEFFRPMELENADEVRFHLPAFVSVFDEKRFDASRRIEMGSWAAYFDAESVPVPPKTGGTSVPGFLTIRGQLAVPWQAPANTSASSTKVKIDFNLTRAKHQQLARYGFVEFHFDNRGREEVLDVNAGFVATLARPAAVKESTVAVEGVNVAFDDRAADSDKVAVAVSLAPVVSRIAPNRAFPNAEVIFLVDATSNCVHQWGQRMRDALAVALRGLLANDTMFNVVLYGETTARCFERSRYANEAAVEAAEGFAAGAGSPLNSTNSGSASLGKQRRLFDAMSTVFTEPCVAGYARTIVLMTNGGCDVSGQRSRVVDLVAANAGVSGSLIAMALGCTADAVLLQRMCEWSSTGSKLVMVAQKYSNNELDVFDDPTATAGTASNDSSKPPRHHNGVASALCTALADTLKPSLASVNVKFVSKDDGSVMPVDKIRLATRLPVSIAEGNRVVVYALASADIPACSVLVTGLVGTAQHSFTADFVGGAKAAELHKQNAQAAGNDNMRTAASFDPVYVAAVCARLSLVEVFCVRSTLAAEQVAECRRLAGTVCLPANGTALHTRSSAGAADEWAPGMVAYSWMPPTRRCGNLPPHFGSMGTETVSAAAIAKKAQQNNGKATGGASTNNKNAIAFSSADADSLFFSLNAVTTTPTSTHQFLRETVDKVVTVVAAGEVASAFARFQRGDGLWDPKNEAIWHALLVRCRQRNPDSKVTAESLRGTAAAPNRRPGSASDLAAARWLAALVVASIENSSAEGDEAYDCGVGALALRKAKTALRNDEQLLQRAKEAVVAA